MNLFRVLKVSTVHLAIGHQHSSILPDTVHLCMANCRNQTVDPDHSGKKEEP